MGAVMVWTDPQIALIRKTVAKDCNEVEFNHFIEVAKWRGLNPLLKQIYAFVFNKGDAEKRQLSIVTSIDGYRLIARRCRDYRPSEDSPEHVYDDALVSPENPKGLLKSTVYCWQYGPDGQWHRIAGEAFWEEFAPIVEEATGGYDWVETGEVWEDSGKPKKKKVPRGEIRRVPKDKWATMPHVMLAKCAEAQALRRGWPEEFSGVYVAEEMDRARAQEDVLLASERAERAEREERVKAVGAANAIMFDLGEGLTPIPLGQVHDKIAAHARTFTDPVALVDWKERNRHPLNEFWAREKAAALSVKSLLEEREGELAAASMQAAE